MIRSTRILFSFILAALATPAQVTRPASSDSLTALCVEYRLSPFGTDGVQRDAHLTERIYRQDDRVWAVHELSPASAHAEHNHANLHAGHKHVGTSTAPHWIECSARGAPAVRMMNTSQQKNYAVEPAEYSNIGFGGSWATAYHLFDPVALKGMRAEGPVRNGVQTCRSVQDECIVTVDWDVTGQYPHHAESHNATGT